METTLARAALRIAEADWKFHLHNCPSCASGQHRRKPELCCGAGALLRQEWKQAQAELDRNRKLDARPIDGQLTIDEALS
jgi:hypothetical protein